MKSKLSIAWVTCICLSCFALTSNAQFPTASFQTNITSGCAPLTVQFTNSSQQANQYKWDFGNGNTSTVANPVMTYALAGTYSVKLVAYQGNNADSVIIHNLISVTSKPVVQFTSSSTSACQGSFIQFQNQSSTFDSCRWDFGDGVTDTTINPQHIFLTAGQFSITLVAYKSGSSCVSSLTKTNYITIHALPVIIASVDSLSSCFTSKFFNFQATANLASTFQWNFGDGQFLSGSMVQHNYAQQGSYAVSVSATTTNGCMSTYDFSSPITILSNPRPIITTNDSIGCSPYTSVLNSSSSSTIQSYLWDLGNGTQSTQYGVWAAFPTAGVFQVRLNVVYANGCANVSLPKIITVMASPVSNFTVNSTTGCKPLTVNFNSATSSSGNTFLWDFGDGQQSTQQSPQHIYQQNGLVFPSLTMTNTNGCSSNFVLPYGINVKGSTPEFTANTTTGCNPLAVSFYNLSNNAISWIWKFGTGDSSVAQSPIYTYQNSGSYNVSLISIDGNGCKDTLTKYGFINPGGSVNNFANNTPLTGCAPFTVSLNDSSVSSSWLWNFGDGQTSSQQNPTHTYNAPGTYVVSLQTQSNGTNCSQAVQNFATYVVNGGYAEFSSTQEQCPPYVAYFTDSSTNAVSWLWNFGDGQTSTLQNPTHTYTQTGSYNVSLVITTADGCTSTAIQQNAINFNMLGAMASGTSTDTVPPYHVQFHANSLGATSWLWTFGDGDSSSLENPSHVYTGTGPFTITLTIANDSCDYTYSFPPTDFGSGGVLADDPVDSTQNSTTYDGCAPLTINFNNPLKNVAIAYWDFGDGNNSSLLNPSHIYNVPGIYDVMLIVTYINGNKDTIYTAGAVKVAGASAQFNLTKANNCSGVSIQVSASSPTIKYYNWNFGDNSLSTLPAPSHTYPSTNNYIISLQVEDSSGCFATQSMSFYAANNSPMLVSKSRACANDTLLFTVQNINFTSYLWDFGDGQNVNGTNVYHAFSDSGSYSVSLTVTDLSGCTQTYQLSTPIEISKPIADFQMSAATSNCNWVNVQFTNTSIGSSTYVWDFGDGTTSTQTNNNKYFYYPIASGYYPVTLTAYKNGCANSKTISHAVYIPDFYVDFNYIRSNGCLPITVLPTDSSNDVVSWKWIWGDGDTSFVRNPSHTYLTKPLTNKIKLIATDANGCTKVIEKDNITLPHAKFTITDSIICTSTSVSFIDSSINIMAWSWDFGDGHYSSQQNPTHAYNQPGMYSPTLVVTDSFGCTDTLSVSNLQVSNPTADFTLSQSSGCAPVVVNFQNISTGALSYLWDFGDGAVSTQENPNHIYATGGNFIVSLTTTDVAGCTATKVANNAIVIPGPVAKFDISALSGCQPFSVSFFDSSLHASDYFWIFSDGDSSKLPAPVHSFTEAGTYQVTLMVHDSNGCQSVFTHPAIISVFEKPIVTFTVSDTIICNQGSVQFTNLSTQASQYTWDFGDGTTGGTQHPWHNYNVAGSYTVMLTGTNGVCSDSIQHHHMIHVIPMPVAQFSAMPSIGCAPLFVHLINQTTTTQNPTYTWLSGNGLTTQAYSPSFQYDLPGFYTITLIAVNEGVCKDSITKSNYVQVNNSTPIPPSPIRYITVLDDQHNRIVWQNSSALNLGSYELFRSDDDGLNYKLIYIDQNPSNTSLQPETVFIDSTVANNQIRYWYKIRVVNNCSQAFPLDSSTAHATIHLAASPDTGKVFLHWSNYIGCAYVNHVIYRSEDGNSFDYIGQTGFAEPNYIDTTAICAKSYTYRIEAVDLNNTTLFSESNSAAATPASLLVGQQTSIVRTTVINNESVLTEWNMPMNYPSYVTFYHLFRATADDSTNFIFLTTVGGTTQSYLDIDVNVMSTSYSYKIDIENVCDVRSGLSGEAQSILLKGFLNDNNGSRLEWTPYKGWQEGVDRYEIQQQDENGNWKTIKTTDGKSTIMDDN